MGSAVTSLVANSFQPLRVGLRLDSSRTQDDMPAAMRSAYGPGAEDSLLVPNADFRSHNLKQI